MSVLVATPTAAVLPATRSDQPTTAAVMRRVVTNLAVACGVPALILYVALQTSGVTVAVLAALAWAYGVTGWRRATGRATSGLLMITVVVLTIRTVFTLSTGNTYVYFLEPVVTDGLIGLLFLGSLAAGRPLVAKVASDFYPVGPELAASPRVQRLFRRLTLMWGGIGLLKSGIGFYLLGALSTEDFVLIKTSTMIALTVLGVAVTIRAAARVLRRVDLA